MHTLSILHLYPKSDFYTGAAIQLYELASALARRGHTVVVATRPSELWSVKCREAGLVHYAVPMRSEFDPWSVRDLARIARAHDIEIVHAHKGKARTLAALAGLVRPIPVLVLNRGVSFPLDRWNRLGYVTGAVTTIVAVSESIRDGLVRQGVPAEKIEVIYSGTDTTRFHPGVHGQALRGELGLEPDHFLVTQVGIRSGKANDDVLTAMALVVPRLPRARLFFVGANAAKTSILRERAQSLGIGDVVTVLGFRDDMPEVLAASDVVVDASYVGLGLTGALREALAVGTPVIATEIEGNPELVLHDQTGLLVPPRAPDRIAEAIIAVAADPVQAQRMAAAGRQRVDTRFSMDVKVERTDALYRRLLAEAQPPNLTRGPSPQSARLEASGRSAATRWRTAFYASSAAFLGLALIVSLGGVFGWERALTGRIALLAIPEMREVFGWITMLGSRNNLYPLGVLALMVLPTPLLRRWWLWILVMVAVVPLEALTNDLVGRPRPTGPDPGVPSGHTASATAFFLTVAYLAGTSWISDRAKATLWSLAILSAALVGVSPLILNQRWPLDVIGGALLGIACAAAAAAWNEGRALEPSPFRSVTWLAIRKMVYRWQTTMLSVLSLVVLFATPPALEEDSLLDAMSDWSGGCLIVIGILVRAWAAGYAGGRTWPERLATRQLTTGGPYAHVRNPVPLANCLIGVGVVVLAENALGLVVVPAVLIAISRLTISVEEEALHHRFGETYAEYCRQVPRWIPRMRSVPSMVASGMVASGPADRFAWDALRSEWPATLSAILLAYVAETSEHLPHLFS